MTISRDCGLSASCGNFARSRYATNSLSTVLVPISVAAAALSAQGTPISHITGRNTSANSPCNVMPPGNRPSAILTNATSATATISTVTIPTSGATPSLVPFTNASKVPVGSSPTVISALSSLTWNGTISAATASAAGVLMTEQIRMFASASGMTGPNIAAYTTITVPATPAMPQLI